MGSVEPSMLFESNLHAVWRVTLLPSSQLYCNVLVSLVVRTQYCAIAFLLVRPSLTQCMNFQVCSQLWCLYGSCL